MLNLDRRGRLGFSLIFRGPGPPLRTSTRSAYRAQRTHLTAEIRVRHDTAAAPEGGGRREVRQRRISTADGRLQQPERAVLSERHGLGGSPYM